MKLAYKSMLFLHACTSLRGEAHACKKRIDLLRVTFQMVNEMNNF